MQAKSFVKHIYNYMARKNIIKIPNKIKKQIEVFNQDDIVVACVKYIPNEEINKYKHLNISYINGELIVPPSRTPDPNAGKFSRANLEGFEKKRTDLPKISKEFSFEAPNWGGYGTHLVSRSRKVFQKDFYPPKEVELKIEQIEKREHGYKIKFSIEQVINRRTPNFEKELLYNLNLLQENVGIVDVFPSIATLADYAKTVYIDWEILPPGTVDEIIEALLKNQNKESITLDQIKTMRERIGVMSKLKPVVYIKGTTGFLRYFGAKFGDDFVVFENIKYGNALYVMYDSWEELSKKSRTELLSGQREGFDRVEHKKGWDGILRKFVQKYRYKNKSIK